MQLKYLYKSDNLLIKKKDKLQLVRKSNEGQFPVYYTMFKNQPRHRSDFVLILLQSDQWLKVVKNLDWVDLRERSVLSEQDVSLFLEAVSQAFRIHRDENIGVRMRYGDAYEILGAMIQYCEMNIRNVQAYTDIFNEKFNLLHNPDYKKIVKPEELHQVGNLQSSPSSELRDSLGVSSVILKESTQISLPSQPADKSEEGKAQLELLPPRNELGSSQLESAVEDPMSEEQKYLRELRESCYLPLDDWFEVLEVLQNLMEQLLAMILHEEIDDELAAIQMQNRNNSAFGRIGSMIGYANSKFDLRDLAESGIVNQFDQYQSLRHYQELYQLDQLENVKGRQQLWTVLQKQLPNNRLLKLQSSCNVYMDVFINNLPYQTHKSIKATGGTQPQGPESLLGSGISHSDETKIIILRSNLSYRTNYVCSLGSDGSINIW